MCMVKWACKTNTFYASCCTVERLNWRWRRIGECNVLIFNSKWKENWTNFAVLTGQKSIYINSQTAVCYFYIITHIALILNFLQLLFLTEKTCFSKREIFSLILFFMKLWQKMYEIVKCTLFNLSYLNYINKA